MARRLPLTNEETWRPVPGYEGVYSVSRAGKVRSEARRVPGPSGMRSVRERLLSLIVCKRTRAVFVGLSDEGKTIRHTVSRLVAEAFLADWDPTLEVYHEDGDPANNNADNLRMQPRGTGRETSTRGTKQTDVADMPGEEWRAHPSLPVSASNNGRLRREPIIRSTPEYQRTLHGKPVNQAASITDEPACILTVDGAGTVAFATSDGKTDRHLAHRLIAAAWHGELGESDVVTFRDGNRSNLRPDNLQVTARSKRNKTAQK